jgi:hypothetical protein
MGRAQVTMNAAAPDRPRVPNRVPNRESTMAEASRALWSDGMLAVGRAPRSPRSALRRRPQSSPRSDQRRDLAASNTPLGVAVRRRASAWTRDSGTSLRTEGEHAISIRRRARISSQGSGWPEPPGAPASVRQQARSRAWACVLPGPR